jgi:hypothetical protein
MTQDWFYLRRMDRPELHNFPQPDTRLDITQEPGVGGLIIIHHAMVGRYWVCTLTGMGSAKERKKNKYLLRLAHVDSVVHLFLDVRRNKALINPEYLSL